MLLLYDEGAAEARTVPHITVIRPRSFLLIPDGSKMDVYLETKKYSAALEMGHSVDRSAEARFAQAGGELVQPSDQAES